MKKDQNRTTTEPINKKIGGFFGSIKAAITNPYKSDAEVVNFTRCEEEKIAIGKEYVEDILRYYVYDLKNSDNNIMRILSEKDGQKFLRLQQIVHMYGTPEQLQKLQMNLAQYITGAVEQNATNDKMAPGFMETVVYEIFKIAHIAEVDESTPDGRLCLSLQELVLMRVTETLEELALKELELLAVGDDRLRAYHFPETLEDVQIFKKAKLKDYLINHMKLVREEQRKK